MKVKMVASAFVLVCAACGSEPPAPVASTPAPTAPSVSAASTGVSQNLIEGYLWSTLWEARGRASVVDDGTYPVVLGDVASQRELGLMEANYGPYRGEGPLKNQCFYYGDGGGLVSVSDEYLARYRGAGLTKETLCMALVSGITHHPETGARLATVQMADIEAISRSDYFGEPGPISQEYPVEIPACFAGGAPLADCTFAYDPWSGARLSASETAEVAAAGARIKAKMTSLLAAGRFAGPCAPGVNADSEDRCYSDRASASGYPGRAYNVGAVYPDLLPLNGFYVISDAYPDGYAYAIGADGAAGPSASMESVSLAVSGKNRATRARLTALKVAASNR